MIFKSHDEAIGYFSELNGKLDFSCINTLDEANEVLELHKGLVEECIEAYYDYMLSVYNNPDLQENTEKISTVLGQIEALAGMLSVLKVKVSMASFERKYSDLEGEKSESDYIPPYFKYDLDEIRELLPTMAYGGWETIEYVLMKIKSVFDDFVSKFRINFNEFDFFEFVEIAYEWSVEARRYYDERRDMIETLIRHGSCITIEDINVEWDDSPFEFDRDLPQEYNSCWDWSYIDIQVVNDELTPDSVLLTYTPVIEPVLLLEAGISGLNLVFCPVEASLNNVLLFGGFAEGVGVVEPIA